LTVDLAPLPAAVPVDSPDVAHGPLTQEATQTPEASKKVEEQVADDTPPVDPSPAPEPEVALAKPLPEEKEEPKEEELKEQVSEKQSPADVSVQQLATAPPRVDVEPAPSSAPSQGESARQARAEAAWQQLVIRQLKRNKNYPAAAPRDRPGVMGKLIVRFRIDEAGNVIATEITQSSGSPILDKEAMDLLKRVSPLPAPPPGSMLDYTLPIDFTVK
jgi:protein TonB